VKKAGFVVSTRSTTHSKNGTFCPKKEMIRQLDALSRTHPQEDHGRKQYGRYSITCLNQALQKKGYNLVYLNKMKFLKKAKKHWYRRLTSCSFEKIFILGLPHGQKPGISHCIARTKGKLIDPDFGSQGQLC
jgi:hypothetical protein